MTGVAPGIALLLLSEDKEPVSGDTLVPLVRAGLRIRVPGLRVNRVRIERPGEELARAAQSTNWKREDAKGHRLRTTLYRYIASHVLQDAPAGFVVYHIDGDRPWSSHPGSENTRKFASNLVAGVRREIVSMKPQLASDDVDRRVARLRPFVPFYSIEAWLYQNLPQLEAIASADARRGGEMRATLADWRANPHLIEELEQPKTSIFGPHHNVRLAQNDWPAAEVYARGQSYRRSVDGLGACADLDEHLRRLSADTAPSP